MRKYLYLLVLVAVLFSFNAVCFAAEVPKQDIQQVVDSSLEIQITWKVKMSYNDWVPLYTKLVRDEAKFTAKYPNSEYKETLERLMDAYDIVNSGFRSFVDNALDKKKQEDAKTVINNGMDVAKIRHGVLTALVREAKN